MFDIFPRALASVASVLFPIFASYKALQSADPAQLTPWLMYWVVLACVVLVESWTDWILCWIPFFHYFRLFFLLYLVLPQTQGARILYQTHVHPYLQHHEVCIDQLIATAHERLRSESLAYIRMGIDYIRAQLGLPQLEQQQAPPPPSPASSSQSYTQALLSRFFVPSARWPGGAASTPVQAPAADTAATASSLPGDLYNLVTSALGPAATTTASTTTQRDRLRSLLSALDRAAAGQEAGSTATDDTGGLRKSRSEVDFVRIDAESGEEDAAGLHKRAEAAGSTNPTSSGSWMPWGWAGSSNGGEGGTSSAVEK